jgi:hypothetical protein
MKQLLQEVSEVITTGINQKYSWIQITAIINRINQELQKIAQNEKVSKDIIDGAKGGEQIAKREKASETKA